MIRVGIVGGAGYTGGELIRLLLRHPSATLVSIHSRSHAGEPIWKVHTDLMGDTDLVFDGELARDLDVLFLCMGHGESKKYLDETPPGPEVRIVDLSQDFRLAGEGAAGAAGGGLAAGGGWVYGLPEVNREAIKKAMRVANPGCFATAIQLGLLPLAKEGWLKEAYTTGITGSTGAGQALQPTTQFTWRADNVSAYKTLTHQHMKEVSQTLRAVNALVTPQVHFVPWRGPFTRGIFVSSMVANSAALDDIKKVYRRFYQGHPFTHLSEQPIDLKQVVQTNKCIVQLEKEGDMLVVHSAIDNLLKGASGQAVQNMNLMFGFEEKAGLDLKAGTF